MIESRNRLVHEYVDDPAELAAALEQARTRADELHKLFRSIKNYAEQKLPPGDPQ